MSKVLISKCLKFYKKKIFDTKLYEHIFFLRCGAETKSDYVELSNFQNRDRFYSKFCGLNKPGTIVSDGGFFHVTFYSNNVFDAKGFQASYYFISNCII